eukprot:TRINITY_DN19928_c0_g1_i1.p1 TRINITY_DN19928_c0_g1~~TRINITY_DN19928_c0_g1_i1.p1  ORF type:complete len:416 (+),score=128.14 TRINITY_DN19928_c0_g1_i1:73-1248(+)
MDAISSAMTSDEGSAASVLHPTPTEIPTGTPTVTEVSPTPTATAAARAAATTATAASDDDDEEESSEDEEEEDEQEEVEEEEDEDEEEGYVEDADEEEVSAGFINNDWLSSWTAEDQSEWDNSKERDYFAALGLSKNREVTVDRVRSSYHRLTNKWHPRNARRMMAGSGHEAWHDACRTCLRKFWLITEAYLVLKDPDRRRIYQECGFLGLRASEQYYENSIFDEDAFEVYEHFFSGADPEIRDYLLLNGPPGDDSEEDDDSDDENLYARENERRQRRRLEEVTSQDVDPEITADRLRAAEAAEARLPPELRSAVFGTGSTSVQGFSFHWDNLPPRMSPPPGPPPPGSLPLDAAGTASDQPLQHFSFWSRVYARLSFCGRKRKRNEDEAEN